MPSSRSSLPILLLLFLVACRPQEPEECTPTTWYGDNDGDGHGDDAAVTSACRGAEGTVSAAGDCDDDNPDVHRGAVERCNEIDDDCDTVIDAEDPDVDPAEAVWYRDRDGDGFGDRSASVTTCTASAGYVHPGDDCDDDAAEIFPGAAEVCNDEDDDCDGLIDGDDADLVDQPTWYDDADADGWGDGGAAHISCIAPEGTVGLNGDCDDGDPDVSPDAVETCSTGDEDCDGLADAADPDLVGGCDGIDIGTADVVIRGFAGEATGYMASSGDYDGDGTDDVMLSAYASATGGALSGAVYVHAGPVLASTTTASASLAVRGTPGTYTGVRAATAGDVDGDGADDLVIGSFFLDDYRGGGWILSNLGSGSMSTTAATGSFTGVATTDNAGSSVAGAGDIDGDGLDDVLIGAYHAMPGPCCAHTGAAYLLKGPATGAIGVGSAHAVLVGEYNGDHAGENVTGLGDIDGDGFSDVAVAAFYNGGSYQGRVYVEHGPFSGFVRLADAPLVISGASTGMYLGSALANVGDMDGDGLADIAIGASGVDGGGKNAGAVYLFTGAPTGRVTTASAEATFHGSGGDYLGASGAIAGADWDGDGDGELLIGAVVNGAAGVNAGAAYLFLGPLSGTFGVEDVYVRLFGEAEQDYLGSPLSPLGDQDGDGLPELLLGSGSSDVTGLDAGSAYVVFSSGLF